MIYFKRGVDWSRVEPAMIGAVNDVARMFEKRKLGDVWITSVREGEHMEGSLHYEGRAVDIRLPEVELPEANYMGLFYDLKHLLPEDFDVVLEETHIHIEYDPK